MLEERQIGIKNADGSIAREAELCAISGRPVLGYHGVFINVNASAFVRVLSEHYGQVNDEWLDAVRASIAAPAPAKAKKQNETTEGEG